MTTVPRRIPGPLASLAKKEETKKQECNASGSPGRTSHYDKPEPGIREPVIRIDREPAGTPGIAGSIGPAAAAQHAVIAAGRAGWVHCGTAGVVVPIKPILDPLPDIPGHV